MTDKLIIHPQEIQIIIYIEDVTTLCFDITFLIGISNVSLSTHHHSVWQYICLG